MNRVRRIRVASRREAGNHRPTSRRQLWLAPHRVAAAVVFMTVVMTLVAFPSQSLAAGCRSFEASSYGHPSRVGAIQVRGADCKTATGLIMDFDATVARGGGAVGSHLSVDGWSCVVLRPYLPTQFTSATDGECLRAKDRVDWIDTEQIPTPSIRFYSLFGVLEGLKKLPATIVIGADGNGAVTGLIAWRGWGEASARAAGTLHQNNCVPSCAQGRVRKSPVIVTLYQRGVYHSHIVYDCLSVTAPAPTFDRRLCLPKQTTSSSSRQPTKGVMATRGLRPRDPDGWRPGASRRGPRRFTSPRSIGASAEGVVATTKPARWTG